MQVRLSSYTSALLGLLLVCSAVACLQLAVSADAAPTSAAASKDSARSSYYELLDLSPSGASDLSMLKRAYRRLALQFHPDKSGSDEDRARKQVQFTRMAQAYKVLKSKRLRTRYDHLLAQGKVDYDAGRDWDDFDASKGFKRKPKSKAQKEADLQSVTNKLATCWTRASQRAEPSICFARLPLHLIPCFLFAALVRSVQIPASLGDLPQSGRRCG
jgi:hypothetical protein